MKRLGNADIGVCSGWLPCIFAWGREKGLVGPVAPALRSPPMLWLGDGGGSTTGPLSLPGRADTFPAFPAGSLGDVSGLPASEFSLGIRTLSFGRMPADLGSAMLLFREGGGGGDVDVVNGGNGSGGGTGFSSAFVAFALLPL